MHPAKTCFFVLAVILPLVSGCLTARAQSNPAAPATPQLDHFDVTQVDRGLDPCVDFYQYTCKKWIAKNPIPPDQANWWLGAKLMLWNQTVVRDILEKASADDPKRNPSVQKIGDYYASCMNEAEINAEGITAIQPELDRIAALRTTASNGKSLEAVHSHYQSPMHSRSFAQAQPFRVAPESPPTRTLPFGKYGSATIGPEQPIGIHANAHTSPSPRLRIQTAVFP